MDDFDEAWIVLIEADGAQLDSQWYRRRDELALRVRGDREQGPMSRRGEESPGVIFQEGCIICPSESFARTMAVYAREAFDRLPPEELVGRFPTVTIYRAKGSKKFTRTREDMQILDRIENVLSRRGRRPAAQDWALSCLECMKVTETTHWSPINCPNCGGFRIHARKGKIVAYADPGGDVVEAWKRLRFSGPHWEPVPLDPDERQPAVKVEILSDTEREVAENILESDVLERLRAMPRETAFAFLDSMLVSRAYRSKERRLETRLETATAFFRRGGEPMGISLTEPDEPDLVDAAGLLGVEEVVTWMLAALEPVPA